MGSPSLARKYWAAAFSFFSEGRELQEELCWKIRGEHLVALPVKCRFSGVSFFLALVLGLGTMRSERPVSLRAGAS